MPPQPFWLALHLLPAYGQRRLATKKGVISQAVKDVLQVGMGKELL